MIVTVTALPLFLLVTLTLEPKGSDLCARRHDVVVERDAARSFGSRLRRVTHGVHRCDTVFGTTGMLSKQNTSAAINRRMRDPRFNWLDAPRGELSFAASQQNAAARQRL